MAIEAGGNDSSALRGNDRLRIDGTGIARETRKRERRGSEAKDGKEGLKRDEEREEGKSTRKERRVEQEERRRKRRERKEKSSSKLGHYTGFCKSNRGPVSTGVVSSLQFHGFHIIRKKK